MVSMTALPAAVGRKTSVIGFCPSGDLVATHVPSNAQIALKSSLFPAGFLAASSAMARENVNDADSAKATRMVLIRRIMIWLHYGVCFLSLAAPQRRRGYSA